MNRSRKIQIALGTILLWSSTAVSSLAATNINPGKNQSNTVNFPVESIPSSQLNLTPDTNLIAGNGDDIYMIALDDETDDHHDDIVALIYSYDALLAVGDIAAARACFQTSPPDSDPPSPP
ncbi:MAG TPA: hypothetical protein DEG17_05785 [Cyanobacteria bacterium UBA11149]|nr:hypothetical protein [Cyanobacteria bacterium UBA11367]HBE58193.1 hypothetical protein [Cyanobacteria bacterium UBA11366]HBK66896.1 hypothetical protein [Cyanobacteria bacterium UBA11166]HBR73457.1 hypothetical protein [Cyanobacteria bacterium UBA11159]HBS71881.1 hypothetical protein [Cyanobacteria bacterium UBA11153]HBW88389.1 hypothetical protein [Cyanobacteria bacterium UBA11149]HCA95492.1 hypothetical protein [Cyanobacteria bacterium UBA9226]